VAEALEATLLVGLDGGIRVAELSACDGIEFAAG